MTALALVDHEGRPLGEYKRPTPTEELPGDLPANEPFHVKAAREAAKQSTPKATKKQS